MTRLSDIAAIEGITHHGADAEVQGVQFDSRRVKPGDLFVALVGAAANGHDYIDKAVANGATALLVSQDVDTELPTLRADDTRAVLGHVAALVYEHPSTDAKIVGVTGTNGKTTCTYILESILKAAGRSPGIMGTVAYRWADISIDAANTTPESAVIQQTLRHMISDGVDSVAMEVSSHGLATHRLEGTLFDVAVFTNLSQDHLDFHDSMDDYKAAKFSLFTDHLERSKTAGKSPVAIINVDGGAGRQLRGLIPDGIQVLTVGQDEADISYEIVDESLDGSRIVASTPWSHEWEVNLPLLGAFNAENAMCMAAAAHVLEIEPEKITAGLQADTLFIPGRMQRVDGPRTVFVDYAHTPDALSRTIATLRPLTNRLVVLFGAGGDRDQDKRPQMGSIVSESADVAVVTTDNPRSEDPRLIIGNILAGMTGSAEIIAEVDRREAIRLALHAAGPTGVVLVAGKGHETYQEVEGQRLHFDDVEEVRNAMEVL